MPETLLISARRSIELRATLAFEPHTTQTANGAPGVRLKRFQVVQAILNRSQILSADTWQK
jgi:hypothetical protein